MQSSAVRRRLDRRSMLSSAVRGRLSATLMLTNAVSHPFAAPPARLRPGLLQVHSTEMLSNSVLRPFAAQPARLAASQRQLHFTQMLFILVSHRLLLMPAPSNFVNRLDIPRLVCHPQPFPIVADGEHAGGRNQLLAGSEDRSTSEPCYTRRRTQTHDPAAASQPSRYYRVRQMP
jgi:hypothetical protein